MNIGNIIAATREAKGWTQPELAEHCGWGYNQSIISHYEKNRRVPPPDKMKILEDILGLHRGALVGAPAPTKSMGGSLGKILKDPSKNTSTPRLVKDITLAYSSDEEWKLDPAEVEILRAWRTLPEDSKSIIQAMFRAQAKGGAH